MKKSRRILIGMLAGSTAGAVVLGIGGRLAMRMIGVLGGLDGGFSWGGTLEVILLGAIIGGISGGAYDALGRYFDKGRLRAGLLFGLLVYGMVLVLPIEGKGAAKGFPDLQWAVYGIFGALFIVFGIVNVLLVRRLDGSRTKNLNQS